MSSGRAGRAVAVVGAMLLAAASAQAQTDAYGTTAETFVPVSAFDFEGYDSTTTTGTVLDGSYQRYLTGAGSVFAGQLIASLKVPNGAVLTRLEMSGCDDDGGNASLGSYLLVCPQPAGSCMVHTFFVSPPGAPGCGDFSRPIDPPLTVDNSAFSYQIHALLSPMAPTVRFRRMGVYYRLQVSPAPATATFADVPVGHPMHRFVEALVAARITAGCSATDYCPDAPLTRGQMAVFLSAALGLHWPD